MIKQFLMDKVIAPTLSGMAELCEKNGITCIFYIEYKETLLDTCITHHLTDEASEEAINALKAIEGKK